MILTREHDIAAAIEDGATFSGLNGTTLESQVEKMRREVQEHGESILSQGALRALCENGEVPSNHWQAVAQIAIKEKWSFTIFPNRSVGFSRL